MSYTFADFQRDVHAKFLAELSRLPPEERLRGLQPEERLRGLPPEERLLGLSEEEIDRLRDLLVQKKLH